MLFKGRQHYEVTTYHDGEVIVREGDTGKEMFIIQEGRVRITKNFGAQDIVLGTLERGEFFGEMSLLESLPRAATVRSDGTTKVLTLQPGELLVKIRRDPTFAFEMLQHMSGRLREIHKLLEKSSPSAEQLKQMYL